MTPSSVSKFHTLFKAHPTADCFKLVDNQWILACIDLQALSLSLLFLDVLIHANSRIIHWRQAVMREHHEGMLRGLGEIVMSNEKSPVLPTYSYSVIHIFTVFV